MIQPITAWDMYYYLISCASVEIFSDHIIIRQFDIISDHKTEIIINITSTNYIIRNSGFLETVYEKAFLLSGLFIAPVMNIVQVL